MINRKKLKRDLKPAVEHKRRRQAASTPCPSCGEKPLSNNPMSRVRLIDANEQPCPICHNVAAANGFVIVEMVTPRGLDDGPKLIR
jgi:hypothetical protein